mgnify:CR=1 FL=1
MFFFSSLLSTSLLSSLRGFHSIVLINNLLKAIFSKDLKCSMSSSFIVLILLKPENKFQTFYLNSTVPDCWNYQHASQVLSSHRRWTSHNHKTKVLGDDSSCWSWPTAPNQLFFICNQNLKQNQQKNTQSKLRWTGWVFIIWINAVPICDEFIVVVADVDQEEELSVVIGR